MSSLVAQVVNLWVFTVGTGLGAAHAHRRTFAAGILPFAHSMPAALRHPVCAGQQRRLQGTGSPSRPPVAQVVNLCAFPVAQVSNLWLFHRSTGFQPVAQHAPVANLSDDRTAHLGRFATEYRRRFGEPPSQTLVRGRSR